MKSIAHFFNLFKENGTETDTYLGKEGKGRRRIAKAMRESKNSQNVYGTRKWNMIE